MLTKKYILDFERRHGRRNIPLRRQFNNNLIKNLHGGGVDFIKIINSIIRKRRRGQRRRKRLRLRRRRRLWKEYKKNKNMLGAIADILDEAEDVGTPVDLGMSELGENSTLLNNILFLSKMDYDENSKTFSTPFLKRILNHVKDWGPHIQYNIQYNEADDALYTPLSWITWHDNSKEGYPITMPLLPFLLKKGYPLDDEERELIPDEVLEAWDAVSDRA